MTTTFNNNLEVFKANISRLISKFDVELIVYDEIEFFPDYDDS
jgi:hypothetical protein